MRLTDFLDKGASLGPDAAVPDHGGPHPQLRRRAAALLRHRPGPGPVGCPAGDKVAILSGNDPVAFCCVFGIARAGAVWCPVNPRNEAAENRALLDLFDCSCLIFQSSFTPLVARIAPDLPKHHHAGLPRRERPGGGLRSPSWLSDGLPDEALGGRAGLDDIVMIAGTGGTTGQPKGVLLTGHNIETMTALTLMSYPFAGRPAYLALAPLTHAAGVLCFPIMTLGGEIVIMPAPDLAEFLALIWPDRVTHAFLPPTLIYLLLDQPGLAEADLDVPAVPLVRGRPDVSGPPGAGHRRDRPGHGAAVRADRGADDDLHHGAGRSPARRTAPWPGSASPPPGARRRW